jgi:hypothetical protein
VSRQIYTENKIGECGLPGPCTKHGNYACDDIKPGSTQPSVEWRRVPVTADGPLLLQKTTSYLYQAWQPGSPLLTAYGATLNEAIATLFNSYGASTV